MCKVLSMINNKGGVGKTTTTLIISELLAYLGFRVLVIDLDGQSSASVTLHAYVQEAISGVTGRAATLQENIFEVFVDRLKAPTDVLKVARATNIKGIDIIPSNLWSFRCCRLDFGKGLVCV